MAIPEDPPRAAPETSAALHAAIEWGAEVQRRARKRPTFLQRLGLTLPVTERDVKQAFFAKAKATHPDHRGDAQQFMQVQQAFDEAIEFAKRLSSKVHLLHAYHIGIQVGFPDQVVLPPPSAEVIASSVFTPYAAFAWRDRPAISFQFHPEFSPDFARALIASRRDRLQDADAAIASLDAPNDNARVGAWIRSFLTR